VVIYGSPTQEFKSRKGGDPLVSFLFLIVIEGLVGGKENNGERVVTEYDCW